MITYKPSKKKLVLFAFTRYGPLGVLTIGVILLIGFPIILISQDSSVHINYSKFWAILSNEIPYILALAYSLFFAYALLNINKLQELYSLVFTDSEIIGTEGLFPGFIKNTLRLNCIDIERTRRLNFWSHYFAYEYIWAVDGERVFFIRTLFEQDQLKEIYSRLGMHLK